MNILLDTHVFLWWTSCQEKIPVSLLQIIRSPDTRVFLSAASSWEVMIKTGLGKLLLDEDWKTIVEREIRVNSLSILPVHFAHTLTLARLPPLHRDPFDRLLIAQCISEDLTLATKDPLITNYPEAKTIWE